MKKFKKFTFVGLLLIFVCCLALGLLSACSVGNDGKDGANGKSAYEIWLDEGHTGTQSDFLNWLKGKDGSDGTGGSGSDGEDGQDGKDGKSAYEIWLDNGHTGTEADFLEWLKGENGKDGTNGANCQNGSNGENGKSAYQIFKEQYPYYQGTEEQWLIALVNGNLRIQAVTFQSEVSDDITKYVLNGYALTDIPEVPEKEGQTSAKWNITDFSNVTTDMTVTAEYDMRKYVTFHNDYTGDEDIIMTVNYGEAITDVPEVAAKVGNSGVWSVTDFSRITQDMQVTAVYETEGLQYVLINQQTQYRVSKGEMNVNTEELFIPAYHDGKPVTVIDTNAFNIETEIESKRIKFKTAHIPDTITEIRNYAFGYCSNLISITIPDSVTSIGDFAFGYCGSLISITIPDSVTSIGDFAFSNCSSLISITIPDSVTSIGNYAFSYCNGLTRITIPDSVTFIGYGAFGYCINLSNIKLSNKITCLNQNTFVNCIKLETLRIPISVTRIEDAVRGCTNLKTIILPKSIEIIGLSAFENCSGLETIYYEGNLTEFKNIYIDTNNESFTDAMVYYYSETKPTTEGYYWHYDTDGVTPVLWVK